MTRRRRLLFLSPIMPARSGNGLAMRAGFFLDAYARDFDVDLAVLPVAGSTGGSEHFARARSARLQVFPLPPVDAHFSLIAATRDPDARLAAFRQYGRPSLTSRMGAAAQAMLDPWVADRDYEAVHVARLYLAPLAERWISPVSAARPRVMMDCDDDDETTYRRMALVARSGGRAYDAAWADIEAASFGAMARHVLPRIDRAFAASAVDAASLSAHGASVTLIPNVIPAGAARVDRTPRPGLAVLFVGNLGYGPNEDGAAWFLKSVWPGLKRRIRWPLGFMLAGSRPPDSLIRLARQRDVHLAASVPDIGACYREADLAVIPIRSGGGTRIKLIEAAAFGVPVVSTTIGAEGTAFRHGRDLLLADTREGFANACADLLAHPVHARRLARRARTTALQNYDAGRWRRYLRELAAAPCERL
jgi:glycosyltransferase involved in cell wall biosynthesis